MAREFFKHDGVVFRLGIKLSKGCVVRNQLFGNAHKSSIACVVCDCLESIKCEIR